MSQKQLSIAICELWRRGWDSNPRPISETPVFKTGSINRSDTPPIQCHHSIPSALRRSQDAARPINRTTKAALSANYRSMQPKSCYGRMSRFFVENIDRALRQPNFRATTNIMHLAKRDENAFYFNRTSRAWHDPC